MKQKIFFWTPRILCIIAILFMMVFSLDVFDGKTPLYKEMLGFLIHNIPAMVLAAVLLVAWKHEFIGGIIFIGLFVVMSILFRSFMGNPASLIVIAPFLLIGILFILHSRMVKRQIENPV